MEWENIPSRKEREKYYGFVYRITNLINGADYVGKKVYWSTDKVKPSKYLWKDGKIVKWKSGKNKGKKKLNPRKNKIHIKRESDWRDYYGSSKNLEKAIAKYGKENFRREILTNHVSAFDLSYAEAQRQFDERVLFNKHNYNGIIQIRLRAKSFIKE